MAIDIHQLRILQFIAYHGSVTAAAAALGLTQSTISHALGRLRAHYGDPLFVRAGHQLVRTPLAVAIVADIERILVDFDRLGAMSASFDPKTAHRTFRVHMNDVAELLFLPPLLKAWADNSFAGSLEVVRARTPEVWQELETGRIDLVIGTPAVAIDSLHRQKLIDQKIVGIARLNHPHRERLSSVSGYQLCRHCAVTPRGPVHAQWEAKLAELFPARRIDLQVPDFLSVPALVSTSDLVAAVPDSLARHFANLYQLRVFDLPSKDIDFTVYQYWPRRLHRDPANLWLRNAIYLTRSRINSV
jgi:DNA-binding transcriptional LysR family regulator